MNLVSGGWEGAGDSVAFARRGFRAALLGGGAASGVAST
jgi:hypothetical protein